MDFNHTVFVYAGGSGLQGALVHWEPRESGLEPLPGDQYTDSSGSATFTLSHFGRYDIEASHSGYNDNALMNKYINSASGPSEITLTPL